MSKTEKTLLIGAIFLISLAPTQAEAAFHVWTCAELSYGSPGSHTCTGDVFTMANGAAGYAENSAGTTQTVQNFNDSTDYYIVLESNNGTGTGGAYLRSSGGGSNIMTINFGSGLQQETLTTDTSGSGDWSPTFYSDTGSTAGEISAVCISDTSFDECGGTGGGGGGGGGGTVITTEIMQGSVPFIWYWLEVVAVFTGMLLVGITFWLLFKSFDLVADHLK